MATPTTTQAEEESRPYCSHCDGITLDRRVRVGFWQRAVLPRFGYFPWECSLCRRVFLLRQQLVVATGPPQEERFFLDSKLLPWRPSTVAPVEGEPARNQGKSAAEPTVKSKAAR